MNSGFKKYFCVVVVLWMSFSFLGFTTATYHPAVHESLHSHGSHEDGAGYHGEACRLHGASHGTETESDENSHGSDAGCYVCNALKHTPTNVSQIFQVSEEGNSLSESFQIRLKSFDFSQVFSSFSGRAPPRTF